MAGKGDTLRALLREIETGYNGSHESDGMDTDRINEAIEDLETGLFKDGKDSDE